VVNHTIAVECQPCYQAVRFQPTLSYTVSVKSLQGRSRPMSCKPTQMGPCQMNCLLMWPTADHEPYSQHMSINEIRRWSADCRHSMRRKTTHTTDWRETTATTVQARHHDVSLPALLSSAAPVRLLHVSRECRSPLVVNYGQPDVI